MADRPRFSNYGATNSDSEITFSGENRELKSLCESISSNVYTINSSSRNLQSVLSFLGTERDNQEVRDKIHFSQLGTNELIKTTTSDVARLSNMTRGAKKEERLQAEKIINYFKESVQGYGKNQLAVAEKLRKALPQKLIDMDSEQTALLEDEERQQLQVQQELSLENDLLLEREKRIKDIESDILDVNQLMRELAAVVNEQGSQVDTIESSIESTYGNIEEGSSHLLSAANYQNKARRRNLCLFVVLATVLTVLIIIIVYSSR